MLAVLVSCGSQAGTAELKWPPTAGVTYNVYEGLTPTAMVKVMSGLTSNHLVWTGPDLTIGYWYSITSVSNGVETPIGGVIQMSYPAPVLTAQGLKAQSAVAYTLIQTADHYIALPVGNIPIGTPCDSTQNILGYSVIPRAAVTWYGTVKPLVVVATCF